MTDVSSCPQCKSEYSYEDRNLLVCSECAFEWDPKALDVAGELAAKEAVVRDAHGNELHDGDTVTVIKDLKVKGSSAVVKVGTKVRGIRLLDSQDGHNIACKIEGFGAMNLKSEFVKKT